MAVMFIISGVMSWYLGKYINKPDGKVYIDAETGEKLCLKTLAIFKNGILGTNFRSYCSCNFNYKIKRGWV